MWIGLEQVNDDTYNFAYVDGVIATTNNTIWDNGEPNKQGSKKCISTQVKNSSKLKTDDCEIESLCFCE